MVETNPSETQPDGDLAVVAELKAAGFANAEEIGRGGFGKVYRCTQLAVDRTVAVKVLTGELEHNRERFVREQQAMGRLTGHPNIVDVLGVGTTSNNRPYLVMPYLHRGSLDELIRREGPLALPDVLRLGIKIAGALETAHRANILHRDIKPGNILITDYGDPALTDFGIAHIAGGFETTTGTILGSPAFTAPELLGGASPSRASDVYGLGATLFCALTGHAAFERRSGEQLIAQFVRISEQSLPDLRERGLPNDLTVVIESAMSRDPENRPSAEQLGERLRQVERNHGIHVEDMALQERPGTRRPVIDASIPPEKAGNLPLELTSFVDRRIHLAEVKNLLVASRLVTLTGVGGVGKSRLALRVAQKVSSDFTDGAWFVELGNLADPELVPDVVAATLGIRSQGNRTVPEQLAELLSSREMLLLLDNCEHLLGSITTLTSLLLRTCPRLRIVATSRETLGVGGESVFSVPPLGIPDSNSAPSQRATSRSDAVALFAERAAAVVPGFSISDATGASVAQICIRLDGLPLAIELAAVRLRTMSPEQILSRLDDRYALLTRGSRSSPRRQQTLQWCIGWSYDLCTENEQQLWRQLSVFSGGLELDAAEYFCNTTVPETELLDTLSALVDKSILIRQDVASTVRFRMLETVQQYGREQAEERGEYPNLARRHRDWCAQLARRAEAEWVGPRQLEWADRLDREMPNIREALEFDLSEPGSHVLPFVNALYLFWTLRGRLGEARRWCERALAHTDDIQTVDRAKTLYGASVIAAERGELVSSPYIAQLRGMTEHATDMRIRALLQHSEGIKALGEENSDLAWAAGALADAVDVYKTYDEVKFLLDAQIVLGWAHALQGDTSRAVVSLEKALTITETLGESSQRSWAIWAMGFATWQEGDAIRAEQLLMEGLRIARVVNDPLVGARCLETLAWIGDEGNRRRRAAVLMGGAASLCRVAGSTTFMFRRLQRYHERCEKSCRRALGDRNFEAAHQEGATRSFESLVALALGEARSNAPLPHPIARLTKRERQIAELVARGLTNRAIAARLVISPRTAEGHVEHILTKLGFTSRAQVAAWISEQTSP
ncbi:protein kinase domain-containing protein [Nocardia nova]|uniref:protein kinase domain-containing protein n=1 Tax=Nocardia nova TaxID=37330 RepID=UPI0007A49D53|nr:protein kinase [Nocardia nova]